jgi:hypothetical protein
VIGDGLYELKFHVEMNDDGRNPHPMDMDHNPEGDGSCRGHGQDLNNRGKQLILGSKSGSGGSTSKGNLKFTSVGKQSVHVLPMFFI